MNTGSDRRINGITYGVDLIMRNFMPDDISNIGVGLSGQSGHISLNLSGAFPTSSMSSAIVIYDIIYLEFTGFVDCNSESLRTSEC